MEVSAKESRELIPGLPEDIALDCLARVPHRFQPGIRPVCRRWRDLVTSPSFRRRREMIGAAEDLVFLIQALVGPGGDNGGANEAAGDGKEQGKIAAVADLRPPVYGLSVYCAADGSWFRICSPNPVPRFAQCAAVEGKLVVVGGWDAATLDPVAEVRILDLATGEWRRGKPMSVARSFFACAAVGGIVYVAGGHDGMKNALRTAEAYDVAADEWVDLPAMAEERDECKGVAIRGKFWAVSGYRTERQGIFDSSAEFYDPEKGDWEREDVVWSEEGGSDACFYADGEEGLWCTGRRGVREFRRGRGWREAMPSTEGMKGSACASTLSGGGVVFVMGSSSIDHAGGGSAGEGYGGWELEIRNGRWRGVETPAGFSGFPYSATVARM
ncbi:F-box/kelch-repeat protein [Apostasia shenzhenica]|uniref:F-box/kelch-repeat protein n=1 Tax=Apostasia shenzhenica TaxID=1088818 RepID=A0A2I0B3M8_9ASPA|nr:F-box/kelch-repeat protein [Apostasia shenzhenica]